MKLWLVIVAVALGTQAVRAQNCPADIPHELVLRAHARYLQQQESGGPDMTDINGHTGFKGTSAELFSQLLEVAGRYRPRIEDVNRMQHERARLDAGAERELELRQSREVIMIKQQIRKDVKSLFGGDVSGLGVEPYLNAEPLSRTAPDWTSLLFKVHQRWTDSGWFSKAEHEISFEIAIHWGFETGVTEICLDQDCRVFDGAGQPLDINSDMTYSPCPMQEEASKR